MKLSPQNLAGHLQKSLAPIYLLTGDEPLQMMEAGDAIRKAAAAQGYTERQVLTLEPGFDWSQLMGEAAAMSLFAERKLIELRMPTGKPGREGGKALREYAANPPEDNILLIHSGKLDKGSRNSAWVKALDKAGASIQIWDLDPAATLRFVVDRLRKAGFTPDHDAARLLTERVEGNLLAAVQEIEKLTLIREPGALNLEAISAAVADSARYDPFELIDAALMGNSHRCIKILRGLQGEGVHEVQILWAITRDVRILSDYSSLQAARQDPSAALKSIWGQRKSMVARAGNRHSAATWARILGCCIELDKLNKGLRKGNVWDELLQLLLWIAGEPVIQPMCQQRDVP